MPEPLNATMPRPGVMDPAVIATLHRLYGEAKIATLPSCVQAIVDSITMEQGYAPYVTSELIDRIMALVSVDYPTLDDESDTLLAVAVLAGRVPLGAGTATKTPAEKCSHNSDWKLAANRAFASAREAAWELAVACVHGPHRKTSIH